MKMKFKKNELLTIIKENRTQHRDIFLEACNGFKKRMIKHIEDCLRDAQAGRKIHLSIGLRQPVDQTAEYDRALRMLDMCVDEVIELDEKTFGNYVMDDWNWTNDFISTTSELSALGRTYAGTKRADTDW